MLLATIRYTIVYSFYALSAFASSFIASLIGGFEQYHPLWTSPQSLGLYVAAMVGLGIVAAVVKLRSGRQQHTSYRYRLAV